MEANLVPGEKDNSLVAKVSEGCDTEPGVADIFPGYSFSWCCL